MAADENDAYSSPLVEHEQGYPGCAPAGDTVSVGSVPMPEDFDSWTKCKQQAWLQMESNPNSFLYRHVMPGEEKRNGPWSEEEKAAFIEAIKIHPPTSGHWGIFSRHVPGRVGYQCCAFYKKLVAAGELSGLDEQAIEANPDVLSSVSVSTKEPSASSPKKKRDKEKEKALQFSGSDFAYMYAPTAADNFLIVPDVESSSNFASPADDPIVVEKIRNCPFLLRRFALTA